MTEKKKIHVCHLVYSFDIGGLERVIANCIDVLDSDDYQHSLIALTEVGEFINEINQAISVYSLHKKKGSDLCVHAKLYNLLKKIKPDILHSYNLATIEYQWLGSLVGVSLQVHAEHGRDSYDAKGTVKKYQILRKVMSVFIDHFISVSEDLHYWLKNDVSIDENKLMNIANGVDTDFYHPNSINSKLAKDFSGKFVFGHVSRLHPIKNQQFLIESFERACMENQDFNAQCVLLLVGDGPDRKKLENLVNKKTSLHNKVIFTGPKTNVRDYYGIFDVFVMSSIAEGIPMTLLEAMSMKIPPLVTSVGGIKEVVLNKITGERLEHEDKNLFHKKMIAFFNNKENLNKMARNSRQRILSAYNQKTMIESYDKLYQRVLN